MPTTYLFDLDGTLIDTRIYAEIYPSVISEIKKRRMMDNEAIETACQMFGMKKQNGRWDSGELCKHMNLLTMYYEILEHAIKTKKVLHDDVVSVFSSLKEKGKKIGIVSNSMHKTIFAYVHAYGLSDLVDFVYSSDDAGVKKDDVFFWKKLILKYSLNPAECVVVGDNEDEDVKMPQSLGFGAFLVKHKNDLQKIL